MVKNLPAKQETQGQGQEDPFEKKMATRPSILSWEIKWTMEPVRVQSMGSKKSWT